jgi:alpha-L-fucosidase 2
MRARGGFEVDVSWKEGKLAAAIIRSFIGGNCRVRYGHQEIVLHLKPGAAVRLNKSLNEPSDKITQLTKEL